MTYHCHMALMTVGKISQNMGYREGKLCRLML